MLSVLRNHTIASYLLTIIRIYLGFLWLSASWGKITGSFDASGYLKGALANAKGEHPAVLPWWADFIEQVALPNVSIINILVPWGEFLVGVGLILGLFTSLSILMGLLMNFSYMFSGSAGQNPLMVILGFITLVAGYNAAKIGLDRWRKWKHHSSTETSSSNAPFA
ncbi:DoxX family protein [Pseudalkalibacillus berkeleyi]|uniref:DoxX family protein n=1 Tax=Pseudalkalibacillus berkeleyi TaxID=1069813 RepID=A0ABS9GX86_9BACL|nr:DoxX family protein [Pseudalkalibacillus berkeleyi]MCF6137397.1 DoxX family protein [Pseudalkalibacillus berkeleyi]